MLALLTGSWALDPPARALARVRAVAGGAGGDRPGVATLPPATGPWIRRPAADELPARPIRVKLWVG